MQSSMLRLAALAAVAAADGGATPSSAALRGAGDAGEEPLWTAEGDEPDGQLGIPRRLLTGDDVQNSWTCLPVLGCLIWCVLPSLIWNNERMAVKREAYLKKAKDHCVIIDNNNVEPPEILVDHVVFASGTTSQRETLVDPVFPMIKAENAVRLRRRVEMYQIVRVDEGKLVMGWKEGRVTCTLSAEALARTPQNNFSNPEPLIPSSSRLDCLQAPAGSVKMGVFYCGAFVRRDMQNWETLGPSTVVDKMKSCPAFEGRNLQTAISGDFVYFAEGGKGSVGDPQIGNLRVSIEVLKCGPLAVLGVLEKKDGWSFLPLLHEHCTHSHALCDDITCKQRQNPHWTGRKEDLPSLTVAVEKIETELTNADRSSLDAQLLIQQTEDIDATDVVSGKKGQSFCKDIETMTRKVIGHEDFIPLTEQSVGYEDFIGITASNAASRVWRNRVNFMFAGVCGVFMILAPLFWFLSIPICMPWSYFCYYPGAVFLVLLCGGAFVCSTSCTALIMAVSLVRFRPLMSILLFSWFALAVVTMYRIQDAGHLAAQEILRPGSINSEN